MSNTSKKNNALAILDAPKVNRDAIIATLEKYIEKAKRGEIDTILVAAMLGDAIDWSYNNLSDPEIIFISELFKDKVVCKYKSVPVPIKRDK